MRQENEIDNLRHCFMCLNVIHVKHYNSGAIFIEKISDADIQFPRLK